MKSIANKQAKEIYERHVRIAAQTDISQEEKTYRNQRVQYISYLIDVYEHDVKDETIPPTIFPTFERQKIMESLRFHKHHIDTSRESILICFSFFQDIFNNTKKSTMERVHASVFLEITRNMMFLYEKEMKLDEEELDDMFLAYDETFRPVFTEELFRISENMKKRTE